MVPLALLFFLLEHKIKSLPNSYNIKKKAIELNGKNTDIIILGTSQALYGLNPSYFTTPTLNLANSSQSLYFDKEILIQQIDNLPKLRKVVLTLTYMSLYYDMNDVSENMRTYAYYHYWGIKNHNFNYFDFKNYSLISLLGIKSILGIIKNNFARIDEQDAGFITKEGFLSCDSVNSSKRISDSIGKKQFLQHNNLIKPQNLTINLKILKELLDKLRKKNITIYFVNSPTYKTYYQNFNKKITQKNDRIINSLCSFYNCKYFDWSKDTNFVKEDFYDNNHLNKYGAAKFSKLLNSRLTTKF